VATTAPVTAALLWRVPSKPSSRMPAKTYLCQAKRIHIVMVDAHTYCPNAERLAHLCAHLAAVLLSHHQHAPSRRLQADVQMTVSTTRTARTPNLMPGKQLMWCCELS
jgi:hypothetical protein